MLRNVLSEGRNDGFASIVGVVKRQIRSISTLYGDMGKRHKTVTIQDFCDTSSKYRVLLSTSAGDCGLNCSSCTLVVQDGFPKSIKDLVQKMGRSGRFRRQEPNDNSDNSPECIIIPTLAERCIHQTLERAFEEPRSDYRLPECKDKCWFCKGKVWVKPISQTAIKEAILFVFSQSSSKMLLSELPKKIFDGHRKTLYPSKSAYMKTLRQRKVDTSESILRSSCHCLVIALLLCKLMIQLDGAS